MTQTTLTFEELDAILALIEFHDLNNLIRLVEENNQYNDDEDVEFWTDILSRLQQQYHHALYTS